MADDLDDILNAQYEAASSAAKRAAVVADVEARKPAMERGREAMEVMSGEPVSRMFTPVERTGAGYERPDPVAFAKTKAEALVAAHPDTTDDEIDAILSWGKRQAAVNAVGAETAQRTRSNEYEQLPLAQKAVIHAGQFAETANRALGGVPKYVAEKTMIPLGEKMGLEAATPAQVQDTLALGREAAPNVSAGAEVAGTLVGLGVNPVAAGAGRLAVAAGAGRVAAGAVSLGAAEAVNQAVVEAQDATDAPFAQRIARVASAGVNGAFMGGVLARAGPVIDKVVAGLPGRLAPAVKGALENMVLYAVPKVNETGDVTMHVPSMNEAMVSTLVMAAFGGARGRGLSDPFKAEMQKRGVPPEIIDRVSQKVGTDLEAALAEFVKTFPEAPQVDPIKAAAEVRGEFDARLAEASKPSETAYPDPVVAAREVAAKYPAKPEVAPQIDVPALATPESVAPTKPVSEAPERMVRVYRGEAPEGVPGQEWLRSIDRDRRGRWFTTDRKTAGDYAGDAGKIIEVEVPESVWRKAQVEAGRGREGGVGEAGAGVLPAEWVSGTKPVSVAPTAPAEAPKGRTLVGTDKRGQQVWEINGRYYTRAGKGPLGAAHPEAVAEAKASRPARETITPADDTPVGKNMAGEPLYERADGSRYRMRNDSPNTKPGGYLDFGGDLAPRSADPSDVAVTDAMREIHKPTDRPGPTVSAGFNPVEAAGKLSTAYRKVTDKADAALRAGVVKAVSAAKAVFDKMPGADKVREHAAAMGKAIKQVGMSRLLTTEYVEFRNEQRGIRGLANQQATDRSRALTRVRDNEKRTDADKRTQYDYFTGNLPRAEVVSRLGEQATVQLDLAKEMTTSYTQRLVSEGKLDKAVLSKYPGEEGQAYLRRVYTTIEQAAKDAHEHHGVARSKEKKVFGRKDLSEAVRDELGEIRDVAALVDLTVRYQGAMLGTTRFLGLMSDTVARDKWEPGYSETPVENHPKYGKLAGKYLPKADYRDIVADTVPPSAVYRVMRTFNRFFRQAHTAWNPGTWMRNNLWNGFASHVAGLDGVNPADTIHFVRGMRTMLAKADTSYAKARDYLIRNNVLGSDFLNADAMEALQRIDNIDSVPAGTKVYAAIGKVLKAPSKFYSMQDNIWKTALFMKATAPASEGGMEMSPAFAVRYVREMSGLPDFGSGFVARIPRSRSGATQVLLNPFQRGAGTTIEYAKRMLAAHPTRTMIAAAAYFGAVKASLAALGLDDKDVEAMNAVLPEWKDVTSTTPILPRMDRDGNPVQLDITAVIPGAREWKTIASLLEGTTDPLEGTNLKNVPFGPLVQLAAALTFNLDPLTMRKIDTSEESRGSAMTDAEGDRNVRRFVAKVLVPDLLPWGGRTWGKLENAFKGTALDAAGTQERKPTQAVLNAMGINLKALDIDYEMQRRMSELDGKYKAKMSGYKKALTDARLTDEEKAQLTVEYESDIGAITQEMIRMVDEVMPRLKKAGLVGQNKGR